MTVRVNSPSLSWREKLGYAALLLGLIVCSVLFPWLLRPLSSEIQILVIIILLVYTGVFVALVLHPYTPFLGSNVRPVDEPEGDDFKRLCNRLDSPVRGVWVTDNLRRSYDFADIWGVFPWNRHLVVDVAFFDVYTPDERAGVIAREASLANNYYRLLGSSLGYLSAVTYFVVVAILKRTVAEDGLPLTGVPFVPELLLVVLLGLGVWYARQKVYSADEFAAEQTSTKKVVNALEKFADEKRASETEHAKIELLSIFWTRPSPSKRIERLREHYDIKE